MYFFGVLFGVVLFIIEWVLWFVFGCLVEYVCVCYWGDCYDFVMDLCGEDY